MFKRVLLFELKRVVELNEIKFSRKGEELRKEQRERESGENNNNRIERESKDELSGPRHKRKK